MKIIVAVNGGFVTAVYCDAKDVPEVAIMDWDDAKGSPKKMKLAKMVQAEAEAMTLAYRIKDTPCGQSY